MPAWFIRLMMAIVGFSTLDAYPVSDVQAEADAFEDWVLHDCETELAVWLYAAYGEHGALDAILN